MCTDGGSNSLLRLCLGWSKSRLGLRNHVLEGRNHVLDHGNRISDDGNQVLEGEIASWNAFRMVVIASWKAKSRLGMRFAWSYSGSLDTSYIFKLRRPLVSEN